MEKSKRQKLIELWAYLEHLDEGYTEVEVCLIAADEACAIQNSDGNNGADIGVDSHVDILTTVQESSGLSQYLRCDTGEE